MNALVHMLHALMLYEASNVGSIENAERSRYLPLDSGELARMLRVLMTVEDSASNL